MHASVVNLEGLSGRALALPPEPPSKAWLCSALPVKPDELPRRASWPGGVPHSLPPRALGSYLPSYLPRYLHPAIAPLHPSPLPGVKLHVVHCPPSNQKLVTSSVTTTTIDAPHRGSQHQSETATP